jgi:hypothetical protein
VFWQDKDSSLLSLLSKDCCLFQSYAARFFHPLCVLSRWRVGLPRSAQVKRRRQAGRSSERGCFRQRDAYAQGRARRGFLYFFAVSGRSLLGVARVFSFDLCSSRCSEGRLCERGDGLAAGAFFLFGLSFSLRGAMFTSFFLRDDRVCGPQPTPCEGCTEELQCGWKHRVSPLHLCVFSSNGGVVLVCICLSAGKPRRRKQSRNRWQPRWLRPQCSACQIGPCQPRRRFVLRVRRAQTFANSFPCGEACSFSRAGL